MSWYRQPKYLWAVLLLSIVANLAMGGYLLVSRPGAAVPSIQRLTERMPPELRGSLRQHMAAHRDDFAAATRQITTARQQAVAAIASVDYDRDVVMLRLKDLRAAALRVQELTHDALLTALDKLSPDERARAAKKILSAGMPRLKPFNQEKPRRKELSPIVEDNESQPAGEK